jgi:hypothetical protein
MSRNPKIIIVNFFLNRLEKEKLLIKSQVEDALIQNEQINKSKVNFLNNE